VILWRRPSDSKRVGGESAAASADKRAKEACR